MRPTRCLTLACLAVVAAAPAASAMTVEEVIAEHVAAHGGRDVWAEVRSMKITGSFTAFSTVAPFTLHRKDGFKYHIDHKLGSKQVVVGYDGTTAWWDNHWRQEGAQRVTGIDLGVLMREVEYPTSLFHHEELGHDVTLLGETDLEGQPTIGVELTRDDGAVETWYLDPKTYLAVARDSSGSDFGQPMDQRTFYDDFREVDGIVIPFFTESQWYTRDRVMLIENVETNVEIDDALFSMPAPLGMGPLLPLAGTWEVATSERQQPGAPWTENERVSVIEPLMGGALLREEFTTAEGTDVVTTMSYDRFRKKYRITRIDGSAAYMDIHEGEFDEDGKLVVSNLETGTPLEMMGTSVFFRVSWLDITDAAFRVEQEVSIDGGENWWVAGKAEYTRRE